MKKNLAGFVFILGKSGSMLDLEKDTVGAVTIQEKLWCQEKDW